MGIPGLYSQWLKKHNGRFRIIARHIPKVVSSLSFDMNGVFHRAAQMTYAYGEYEDLNKQKLLLQADPQVLKRALLENIGNIILKTVVATNPTDLLVLAVDGVAPVAKMDQQRKRRYLAATSNDTIFNKNQFTPGTELMFEVDAYIKQWIETNRSQLPDKVIYSPHTVSGEGEHKIFTYMRQGEYNTRINREEYKDTSLEGENYVYSGAHVIYGLDADIIMLSVIAPLKQIYLMRESERDIVNIDSLRALIKHLEIDNETFVILSFLIGNDFIPKQPSLEDLGRAFDEIISATKGMKLSDNGNINWNEFKKFIDVIVRVEEKLLNMEVNRKVKYMSNELQKASSQVSIIQNGERKVISTLNMEKFTEVWNHYILDPKADSEVAKKLGITSFFFTEDRLKNMVFDYLNMLNWIFNYYMQGVRVDPMRLYHHHYTPLFRVIKQYIDEFVPDIIPLLDIPYNPVHQLLAVLPRNEILLIPVEAQHLMLENSPLIDMYPDDFYIDYNGKNNEHTGIALLPHINIVRIMNEVSLTTSWKQERADKFTKGHDYKSVRKITKRYSMKEIENAIEAITQGKSNVIIQGGTKLEPTDIVWKAKDLTAPDELSKVINYKPGIVVKLQ